MILSNQDNDNTPALDLERLARENRQALGKILDALLLKYKGKDMKARDLFINEPACDLNADLFLSLVLTSSLGDSCPTAATARAFIEHKKLLLNIIITACDKEDFIALHKALDLPLE
jgi:hypothetical protein